MNEYFSDIKDNCDIDTDSTEKVEFVCDDSSLRLDNLVSINCEITRSSASKLIEQGLVSISGKVITKKSHKASKGQVIIVILPSPEICEAVPQDIPVEIVYEDSEMLIVNKPQGMVVHPAPGNFDGTLVNALMYHCEGRLSSINGVIRPGIVHRIDKDTSGLLAVAKTDEAHSFLSQQIKAHSFKRVYHAIVTGNLKEEMGTIDLPIGRNPIFRKKMAVTEKMSRPAVTHYKTMEHFSGYSYMELTLETGRTHQIRVHLSHLGHPVVGDPLYAPQNGKNPFSLTGQALHAHTLGIIHPKTLEYMEFSAPIPPHFEKALKIIKEKHQ